MSIETSGYAEALQSAVRGLAYGGTISYVAFANPFAEGFNLGREAHFNIANSPESYMQYVDQHPEQSIKMGVTF